MASPISLTRPVLHRPFARQPHHDPLARTRLYSVLLNLPGLSASRESQHFAKERKLPRIEYSSNLQLIRSGEVDPFNAPGASAFAHGRARIDANATGASGPGGIALLKELEDTRREIQALHTALGRLSGRYYARDREARVLSWTVLVLFLGFVFPAWLSEPVKEICSRIRDVNFRELAGEYRAWFCDSTGEREQKENTVEEKEAYSPTSDPPSLIQKFEEPLVSRPIWERLFWASPC